MHQHRIMGQWSTQKHGRVIPYSQDLSENSCETCQIHEGPHSSHNCFLKMSQSYRRNFFLPGSWKNSSSPLRVEQLSLYLTLNLHSPNKAFFYQSFYWGTTACAPEVHAHCAYSSRATSLYFLFGSKKKPRNLFSPLLFLFIPASAKSLNQVST